MYSSFSGEDISIELSEEAEDLFSAICDGGLILGYSPSSVFPGCACTECLVKPYTGQHQTVTISPLTIDQMFSAYGMLIRDEKAGVPFNNYMADQLEDGDVEILQSPVDKRLQEIDGLNDYDAWINVDLRSTDKQIVMDFTKWLSKYREFKGVDYSAKSQFTDGDFKRWINLGVLPYIDLKLYSLKTGMRLTEAAQYHALFPGQMDGQDRIRKTVAKHAVQLLSNGFLEAIRLQAMNEHLESRKKTEL